MGSGNDSAGNICPACGNPTLSCQQLPGGAIEQICLNAGCDYQHLIVDPPGQQGLKTAGQGRYEARLARYDDEQLQAVADHLQQSLQTLTGRQQRTAARQLKLARAELKRRAAGGRPQQPPTEAEKRTVCKSVPPQLNTPQARAKRLKALRQYHARLRELKQADRFNVTEHSVVLRLQEICQALRRDAEMHYTLAEQLASRDVLHAAHIDHLARASELNRVLQILEQLADRQPA